MPAAKYLPYGINDLADFKVGRLQNLNAHKLLKEIIFRWRGSNVKVKGKPGRWAVWPIMTWAEWAGLSSDQTERALRSLAVEGLIVRERHRWAGSEVRAFIQPSKLALQHMGRPGDIDRLSGGLGNSSAGSEAGTSAGIGAGTDYTSFPSNPTKSSKKEKIELAFVEGKGKAATECSPPPQAPTPQSPPPPQDAFPILTGKHEKFVSHPSKMYPDWSSFSPKAQAKLYAKYECYVSNWYKGKAGKPYALATEITDEEWADISAQISMHAEIDDDTVIASYAIPKKAIAG